MPKEFIISEAYTYKCDIKQISKSFPTEKERDQYRKRHWKFCKCRNYQYIFDETTYGNTKKTIVKDTNPTYKVSV